MNLTRLNNNADELSTNIENDLTTLRNIPVSPSVLPLSSTPFATLTTYDKCTVLSSLRDQNHVLFYNLCLRHLNELLPSQSLSRSVGSPREAY